MVTVMQRIPAVIHRNVRIHSERRWSGVKHDVSRPWIVRQVCSKPIYVEPGIKTARCIAQKILKL